MENESQSPLDKFAKHQTLPDGAILLSLSDRIEENGKTVKENNLTIPHKIPIGALVEVCNLDEGYKHHEGVRLFVVYHQRDCDGTPLYCLSDNPDDTIKEREGFSNDGWHNGYPEDCLEVIKPPSSQ